MRVVILSYTTIKMAKLWAKYQGKDSFEICRCRVLNFEGDLVVVYKIKSKEICAYIEIKEGVL